MDAYIGGDHMHVYEFIAPNWYDHYRRILSDDKLTVCQSVMEWMTRKSCWDRCSFRQAFAKYFRERSSNG